MTGLCSLRKKSLRVIWNDHVTDSASNYYPYGRSWDAYYKIFTVYSISRRKTYTKIHTISRKGSPLGSFRTSCSILSEKYRYYRRKVCRSLFPLYLSSSSIYGKEICCSQLQSERYAICCLFSLYFKKGTFIG